MTRFTTSFDDNIVVYTNDAGEVVFKVDGETVLVVPPKDALRTSRALRDEAIQGHKKARRRY